MEKTMDKSAEGWMPWAGAGGAALLAHALMSPDEDEKKKESIWSKLMRWLTVAGAGAGAYYLADSLGGEGGGQTPTSKALNAGKWTAYGGTVGLGGRAYLNYNHNKPTRLRIRGNTLKRHGVEGLGEKLIEKGNFLSATRKARMNMGGPNKWYEQLRRILSRNYKRVPGTKGGTIGGLASAITGFTLGALADKAEADAMSN